jgi:hypothetical protein
MLFREEVTFSKGMRKHFVPFLVFMLFFSLFIAFPCKGDIVWSDNFDDGNYDGWIVWNGTFSAEDHTLKPVLGAKYWIGHVSTVTNGTWSFDELVGGGIVVWLMHDNVEQGLVVASYFDTDGFHLRLYSVSSKGSNVIGDYIFNSGISSWQHIDVTRNVDGRTCLYLNGTLLIDVVDQAVIKSWFFEYLPYGVAAIDNIVVSNTIDIQLPPPFYMQTWFIVTVGAFAVAIIVSLLMHKKQQLS